jgi:GT2 family glycosyltransferase
LKKSIESIFAIVLNYNGYLDSKECIESLLSSNYQLNIIIIDNNSSDDSYNKLIDLFSDLHFIKSEKNLGFAGGMNLGIKFALSKGADYVILVNQDTVVSENFLLPLLDNFKNDKTIGIASPKVLYKNNKDIIYCAGGRVSKILCTGVAEFQGKCTKDFANEDRVITLAEGCFLMIKSEVFNQVGFLNEKFFMYLEDVEFSERVSKYFKIIYAHNSIVYHKSGAGEKWSQFSSLYNYYYTRNRLWYYENKNFPSKIYVFLISILIVLMKSFNFIIKDIKDKERIIALWSGLFDGVKLMIKNNKFSNWPKQKEI